MGSVAGLPELLSLEIHAIRDGDVSAYRIGKHWHVRLRDVDGWIERNRFDPTDSEMQS